MAYKDLVVLVAVSNYVVKPFSPAVLAEKLAKIIPQD